MQFLSVACTQQNMGNNVPLTNSIKDLRSVIRQLLDHSQYIMYCYLHGKHEILKVT